MVVTMRSLLVCRRFPWAKTDYWGFLVCVPRPRGSRQEWFSGDYVLPNLNLRFKMCWIMKSPTRAARQQSRSVAVQAARQATSADGFYLSSLGMPM